MSEHPSWAWRPLHGPNPYGDPKPHISPSFGSWCCSSDGVVAFAATPRDAYRDWQDALYHVRACRTPDVYAHL